MLNSLHIDGRMVLFLALGLTLVVYLAMLIPGLRRARTQGEQVRPTTGGLATGFVTNFWDTLGIGSFATTTAIFRQWKMVRDEQIPGTLNVGHTLPTIAQAFIYTQLIKVDPRTLIFMIIAAVLGTWLGAGFVARWPRRRIQIGMGTALIAAAAVVSAQAAGILPPGGELLGLDSTRLTLAVVGNFVLGALMTLGIGLYAPCMILISLLGMNPTAAFPIMMGSCAFLMPIASDRFIRAQRFDPKASVALFVGGIPAVLIAAYIVKSMDVHLVRWLVVVVVLYTSISMLLAARRERASQLAVAPAPEGATS
jgi:uncharacterized membrane protein YfcA